MLALWVLIAVNVTFTLTVCEAWLRQRQIAAAYRRAYEEANRRVFELLAGGRRTDRGSDG